MFEFRCVVHKKPQGNWRPKVELQLLIKAEDYPHRPLIKGLTLAYPCHSCMTVQQPCFEVTVTDYMIVIPGMLWTSPKKGEDYAYGKIVCSQAYGKYGYKLLLSRFYLDFNVELKEEFYLDWRDGEKPDYSDYIDALKKIPMFIEKQLREGTTSGETQEVVIISGNSIIVEGGADVAGIRRRINR